MSLVPMSETGELVEECTVEEAQRLTAMIKSAAEDLWSLLLEAHDRKAWTALGYGSFSAYATSEFEMSEVHAYRLLGQGEVIREIEAATGLTHGLVKLSERAARDVKPNLKGVTEAIRVRVTTEAPTPERVKVIVSEVVAEERAKVAQRAEDREALSDLRDLTIKAGLDQDGDRIRQRGEFSRLCRHLSELPEPAEFIERHQEFLLERHVAQAERAYAWLDAFLIETREKP